MSINNMNVEQLTELAEFLNFGYEVEDGQVVRTVNNETGATIWTFEKEV